MEYSVFKQEGSITLTYADGTRWRSYPVSCTDRTVQPWGAWSPTSASFGTRRLLASNRTPDYWAKKKSGVWIPPNSFYSSRMSITSNGMSDIVFTWYPAICSGPAILTWDEFQSRQMPSRLGSTIIAIPVITGDGPVDLITQVSTETLANRQKGEANLIESLAELDQLFKMVGNPIGNLGRFAKEFARSRSYRRLEVLRKRFPGVRVPGQLSSAARRTKLGKEFITLLSSEYLRWRYGVKPFISDVQAVMKTLKTSYKSQTKTSYHTARAKGTLQGTAVDKYTLTNSIWTIKWEILRTETFSVHGQWVDQYESTPWTDLGLTWHNLIGVPWELTRRSFVLDWFVNVGEVIYANLPRVGVVPKGGSVFSKRQLYHLCYFTGYTATNPAVTAVSGNLNDTVIVDFLEKRRKLIDRDRAIGLVVKSDFRFDHWTRALDAAALTSQLLMQVHF